MSDRARKNIVLAYNRLGSQELQNKAMFFAVPDERRQQIDRHWRRRTTRFCVVAITGGLLLAVSGPSVAAKRMSDTKSAVKSQSRATTSSGSAIRPYSRDPYSYSRDTDPYAPGVNWPKSD